jgi:alpha-ketoglutarate-dependent taurine dioxygenase
MHVENVSNKGTTVPVVHVETPPDSAAKAAILAENRPKLDELLLEYGAVYLRHAGISSPEEFRGLVDVFGDPLDSYRGGNTPRAAVGDGVFTSTEFPAQYEISMHNEMSYAYRWPERLFFCCLTAPGTGGATPITDGRALLADLDHDVRARFEANGVSYRQNLHGGYGLGKSWQQTFETSDRQVVEEYLRQADAEFRWTADDELRVVQTRLAVREHPHTHEQVWFSQADQWHPSGLPPADAEALRAVVSSDEELPHSATYGDGSEIPDEDLDHVRAVANRNQVAIPWAEGDFMMVDNMLALHGRQAFAGARRVIVAMT